MGRRAAFVVVLCAPALLVASIAAGQKTVPKATSDARSDRYDPENRTALSQHMETLIKGNEKYAAKDYNAAVDLYKQAIQLNPRHPLGPYLLGEAYLALGNLGEAEAAFKQAAELDDPRNPQLKSHALFALSDCFERERKFPEARAAWQKYAENAPKVPDAGAFPQSAAARMKAIDDWMKLEQDYVKVRERIANEKKDAGAAPPKK